MAKRSNETAVAVISPEQQAIAVATAAGDVESLQHIAAMATGLKEAAKKRHLGVDAENKAAEVIIRAERGLGITLLRMKDDGLVRKPGRNEGDSLKIETHELQPVAVPSIADFGINKDQSSKWQQLAGIDEEQFENLIREAHEKAERIAKVDFYRLAREDDRQPADRVKALQELVGPEPETTAFVKFKKAALALDLSQLPDEELVEFAGIVKGLASGYTVERAERMARN